MSNPGDSGDRTGFDPFTEMRGRLFHELETDYITGPLARRKPPNATSSQSPDSKPDHVVDGLDGSYQTIRAGIERKMAASASRVDAMERGEQVTVTLVEDLPGLPSLVEPLLTQTGRVDVIDRCRDLDELLVSLRSRQPTIVFIDHRVELDVTLAFTQQFPNIGVLVSSEYAEPDLALEVLGDGSRNRGCILRQNLDAANLEQAILAIADGGSYVDTEVLNALVHTMKDSSRFGMGKLSSRELEVLEWLAQGLSNREISAALFIGERTVEKHVGSIYAKLNLARPRTS